MNRRYLKYRRFSSTSYPLRDLSLGFLTVAFLDLFELGIEHIVLG
jgi:hypothetical protein